MSLDHRVEGMARYEAGPKGSSQIMRDFREIRSEEDLLLGEMEHPGRF